MFIKIKLFEQENEYIKIEQEQTAVSHIMSSCQSERGVSWRIAPCNFDIFLKKIKGKTYGLCSVMAISILAVKNTKRLTLVVRFFDNTEIAFDHNEFQLEEGNAVLWPNQYLESGDVLENND